MEGREVSVVVPVYNGAHFLATALDSILAQELGPREIIVVDDGSTDGTSAIVDRFADRVTALVRQPNAGPAVARNTGIERASAPFVAFLDADDLWRPVALTCHLACLEAAPRAGVAWGLSDRVVAPGGSTPADEWHGRPQRALCVSSMLFRRGVLQSVGGFDPTLRAGEDLDLMFRLREQGHLVAHTPEVVCERRIHAKNVSRDGAEMTRAHFVVLQKAFARWRSPDSRPQDEA